MASFFIKQHPGAGVEAASLNWLRAAEAVPIVEVVSCLGDTLTLARLASVAPSRSAAIEFGQRLARLHDAGATAFGSPPPGWHGDGYIGTASLSFGHYATWGAFYAQKRVLPYATRLTSRQRAVIDKLVDRLLAGVFDDGASPARIHGDLWSGNVMFTPAGVTLIDPAAHGGHRITDLAMLSLFGAPFLDDMLAAYADSSHHLPEDWRNLIALHQVHPLLVHDILFGGDYGQSAARAAAQYL